MGKIASLFLYNALLFVKDMKRDLHKTFLPVSIIFSFSLSVSNDFKNLQMSLGRPQIWVKIEFVTKIIKNQQMVVFVVIPSTVFNFYI